MTPAIKAIWVDELTRYGLALAEKLVEDVAKHRSGIATDSEAPSGWPALLNPGDIFDRVQSHVFDHVESVTTRIATALDAEPPPSTSSSTVPSGELTPVQLAELKLQLATAVEVGRRATAALKAIDQAISEGRHNSYVRDIVRHGLGRSK